MLSHTVPKKLLEHFAYDDPHTKSKRLWRYEKGRRPHGNASPKSATRWDRHFAHPENAAKELEIENRLEREFEDPVNKFVDCLGNLAFPFTTEQIRDLTKYITMLFHRSQARRNSSEQQQQHILNALRGVRNDEDKLGHLVAKQTMEMIARGDYRMPTREQARAVIDDRIAEHSKGSAAEVAQRGYIQTMENMMALDDKGMRNGEWRVLRAQPDKPFVIGDAPVVTWARTEYDVPVLGEGFARPNVEVFLPIFPTVCLQALPKVARTRRPHSPTTDEVNMAQAQFSTKHCFTNLESKELDDLLQPHFGNIRLGFNGFSRNHMNATEELFQFLMNHRVQ